MVTTRVYRVGESAAPLEGGGPAALKVCSWRLGGAQRGLLPRVLKRPSSEDFDVVFLQEVPSGCGNGHTREGRVWVCVIGAAHGGQKGNAVCFGKTVGLLGPTFDCAAATGVLVGPFALVAVHLPPPGASFAVLEAACTLVSSGIESLRGHSANEGRRGFIVVAGGGFNVQLERGKGQSVCARRGACMQRVSEDEDVSGTRLSVLLSLMSEQSWTSVTSLLPGDLGPTYAGWSSDRAKIIDSVMFPMKEM